MAKKKKYKTALDYYNEKNNIKKSDSKKIAKLNADIITGKIINPSAENKQEQINKKQQKKVKDLKKKVDEEKKELGIYEKYKSNQEKVKQSMFVSSQDRMKYYANQSKNKKTIEQTKTENLKKAQQERKEIDKLNKNYEKTSKTYKTYEEEKNKSELTRYLADQERVENEEITTLDKINILRPYLANLEDALDANHEYTLENGSKVSLPTYRELKSSKVQSEMGKIGQAIHSASGSLGSYTPAMVTSLATSAIPYVGKPLSRVTGGAMTFATTYNSAKNRKLLEGYSEREAENYAKVNASLETGLGMAIGGLSKTIGGNGTLLTKNLAKVSEKVIQNEGARYFVSHLVAEETEELAQMVLDPINEHITLGEHESISEALSTIDGDEATITALSTLFSIGLTEGPTALNINTLSKNIDAINKQYGTDFRIKTDSNQVVDGKTNKDATARFEELRRQSKISKYQEQQITELETRAMQVESDYETGKITEEQYKEETQKISYEAKLFKQEQENNILNPITKIEVEKEILDEKFNSNQITEQEYDKKVAELDNKLKEIAGKEDNTKYSQNENQVPYQYEKSNNIKVDNLKQSASQYFDNAEDTHELINTYEKIIVDKNYNVLFDDTITNIKGESVNAKITTLKNGEVEIRINPNSERAGEFLIMHEVTHAIETDSLKQLVVDFAKQNKDFDKALTDLKQAYGTEDVSSEVLADISGQLLGNQEFINSLKMQNTPESKNIIKQIYESIVRILNKLTAKGRYRNFVQDLETKWREAYQTQTNNLKGETKLSTIGIKGAKNLSNSDVGREYKHLYRNQKVAEAIFKISKQDLENTNKITKKSNGWFKTKYGDWGTLISDKNAKLTKQLENNKTYRLGDIFEHDLLYKAYPELINMHIETADFPKGYERYNAFYNPLEKEIYFNNAKLKKLNTKGTLLHEINHYIEDIEGFDKRSTGSEATDKKTNRNDNLGEIISNEAKLYSEYSQKELDNIFPEQAKNNPTHANLKLELEKNRKQMYNKNERGIFDYETGKYTNEEESTSKNKKIEEIIKKGKTNTLKFEEELDNSSFSLEHQLENQANDIMKNKQAMVDYFNQYLEEEGITNPTDEDIRNSLDSYDVYDSSERFDSEVEQEYFDTIKEHLSEKSKSVDNKGRKLTKKQQKYFKDSKARDKNGKLVTVYHTTTEEGYQFNEFNPVGTNYYRFGEQVVNYYTDDKEMSGSYANQDYIMADTKKLSSMKQVKDYIKKMNSYGWGSNKTYELIEDNGQYKLINNSIIDNIDKTWQQVYDEANEYKKSLTKEEMTQFKDMFDNEVRSDRAYDIDSYLRKRGYEFGSKQDEIAHKYLTIDNKNATEAGIYFDVLMRDAKYRAIGSFDTLEDLYRNLKTEGQMLAKRQYEGYVNIKNPYIIDAEGRNWNRIKSKEDSATTEKMIYMDTITKDRLSQLAKDSKKMYDEAYSEYKKWLDAVNSIDGSLREENTLEMRSMNHVFRNVLASGVDSFINKKYQSPINSKDESLNKLYEWRTNNDIMTALVDWDLITQKEYDTFNESLEVPDNIREKVRKLANTKVNYNEYDEEGRNPTKKQDTIYNVWKNHLETSKHYSNIGKYEYSVFDSELLSGYLNEELKSSFPIKDEFGINDDSLKALYKVASHDFDENYIRSNYNEWSVTNDIVKQIIELNKFGENYDGLIMKNVVDYGGKSENHEAHDLYITFNSNQFKAIDNTNPTYDSDIRYSSKSKGWQEHLEENYEATGTRTNFSDIRQKTQETNTTEVSKAIEPVMNDIKTISDELKALREELGLKESKVLNPNTIANITKEDASTTPKLPNKKVSTGRGKSRFADNIMNKTDMLEDTSKEKILAEDEVKYYEEVTNKESLQEAFDRLENGGASETMSWFNKDSKNADSTDVAEGWILMKQYQDNKDYDGMVQVAKKLREIGTKAGQTVQAFNIMERMTPEGMVKYAQSELETAYENMIKNKSQEWIENNRDKFDLNPSEVRFIMDNMQEVATMEDGYNKKVKLAEIQKLMTDKLPPEKGAGIKAWMRISMLFNPKTQVRNILGNAIVAPVNMVGDTFASMVDRAVSKKTGVRTTGMTKLSSYGKGMKEGVYQSYNDFKKGINTRNIQGDRFEIGEGKSFNDKRMLGKALNRVDNMLSFMLDAGDRTFYEASFTNSINNQLALNKTDVVTQDMIDIATTEALQRTWQDNNKFTKFVLRTRKGLNNLIGTENFGLGDVLIPFAKTPANLTKALIDYSPAGVIGTITSGINLKRSLNNGQYTAQMQHKFVQNLGKATAGTILYAIGYALATSGVIGGEADEDKDVANFMKNTLGISNYSIKIGNKSFTYDWAQPVAGAFSTMANIVNSQNKEQALLESIVGNLDTAGAILLEQSFLQSINEVLNNQDGAITGLVTQVLELPSRAIPTFSKQIADLLDGTQRTSFEKGKPLQTAVNQAKAKIPGLSKTLAPSVDTLGREIQKYGGNNSVFNVFFNPANVNSKNVSESAKEIYRLYQTTGNKQLMPRVAPYDIEIEGKKRLLTSTERTNYQKQAGKIVEDAIKELLKSPTYKKLSDADKSKTITDIINYAYNKPQEKYGKSIASEYKNADKYVEKGGTISGYYCINNILKSYDTDYEEAKDNLDSSSSNYSAEVDKLSATKRKNIINAIINTNVNKGAKAYLYGKYYGNPETINAIVNSGINFNEYLKFARTEYTSDKDSDGDTIRNSRKNKIFSAINSLKLTKLEKAMLMRTEYSSFDDYNYEIFEYVNKLSLTKSEKQAIFETLGFEIKGGKIYW